MYTLYQKLYLNIFSLFTPYSSKAGSTTSLTGVFFWVTELPVMEICRTKIGSSLQSWIFSLKACFPSMLSNQKTPHCNVNVLFLTHLLWIQGTNYSLLFCSSLSRLGRLLFLHSLPFSAYTSLTSLIDHVL